MLDAVNELDAIQTAFLRALASPYRLRILHLLGNGRREVNELVRELGLPQAAVSQHLAALRAVGVVEASRDGRFVRYGLTDPEILTACDTVRRIIVRRLSTLGDLAAASAQRAEADIAPTSTPSAAGPIPTR